MQVVTLEALLQQSNTPDKDRRASEPGAAGGKGAQGLTYVMASGGRLWSTALRLESQRAEGASERTIRCGQGRGDPSRGDCCNGRAAEGFRVGSRLQPRVVSSKRS